MLAGSLPDRLCNAPHVGAAIQSVFAYRFLSRQPIPVNKPLNLYFVRRARLRRTNDLFPSYERSQSMIYCTRAFLVLGLTGFLSVSPAFAGDPHEKSATKRRPTQAAPEKSKNKDEQEIRQVNLLDAARSGEITVKAEGRDDGRMTVSLTNRTRHQLRVVLPPGIIAQSATGQFGGMGGMGGGMGMMGGGMGGGMGGMGGGMGMMGGGMGMMGGGMGGGMMGGMGGMGRRSGTMPSMMGMFMLARMIMYFCGDPDSWDMRSLMIGMMGMRGMGGMGGGMGMMGGGMGMMGGMGGGMRSVPPTGVPSAVLGPGQTRHLPTRLVSLTPPDPATVLKLPAKGEPLALGDITETNEDPRVQTALRRLSEHMAPSRLSQVVMWHVCAGLDWSTISQLSGNWVNRHELTLAQDFVARLDTKDAGENARIHFEVSGSDEATEVMAADLSRTLQNKMVLGLLADTGMPPRPNAPAVACRVKLNPSTALVQVYSSDGAAQHWVAFGKFSVPVKQNKGKLDAYHLCDEMSEGILNRLVRAHLSKGVKDKGKMHYDLRIDNASPLVLNGLAALGVGSKADEVPKFLVGISIAPRRSLTVPASENVVKELGLKKGIRLVGLNLSGL
jgi:hypothetical protein